MASAERKVIQMAVKWGVLGTANIARGCTIPGMKEAENCELYAIAGRNAEKVNSFKEEFGFVKAYTGYGELLQDPGVQAVYIPLPNHLHREWVIKALRAGKHVLCEKPLALNADEAEEMFAVAKENNVYLMEAYAYLHTPYIDSLKNDLKSGIIGDVDYIETAFITQGYKEDIRLHKDMGGGAVYDLGCYCTTMILTLTDSEPENVMAQAEFGHTGVDVFTSVIMKLKNGVRAAFDVGMIFPAGSDDRKDRLFIHGSKGTLSSDVEYNQAGELKYTIVSGGKVTERVISVKQNYALETAQLGRCIENGEKPHISQEFSIKNARLLDVILEKAGY
ncbi:MAG: Gfo/Idh/MocA family oxidoreductase [Lachnospiraceae bacterium]|nr:Gfo/Idh/MocA family oxidoreductase [Lachnospiraceae bacterium]